jgi:hypothetical protein
MAKWDAEKLDEALKKAIAEKRDLPVPVSTKKVSHEDTLRRYEKG